MKLSNTMKVPKQEEREIAFMLYNYKNIDKLIDQRKNNLIDNVEVTNRAYLNSIHAIHSNTLEDVVEKFDTDNNITRLKGWKKLLNSILSKLYDEEDKLYYYFIKFKYFENMNEETIQERLNITSGQSVEINMYLKWVIYQYAIKAELYESEVA